MVLPYHKKSSVSTISQCLMFLLPHAREQKEHWHCPREHVVRKRIAYLHLRNEEKNKLNHGQMRRILNAAGSEVFNLHGCGFVSFNDTHVYVVVLRK